MPCLDISLPSLAGLDPNPMTVSVNEIGRRRGIDTGAADITGMVVVTGTNERGTEKGTTERGRERGRETEKVG